MQRNQRKQWPIAPATTTVTTRLVRATAERTTGAVPRAALVPRGMIRRIAALAPLRALLVPLRHARKSPTLSGILTVRWTAPTGKRPVVPAPRAPLVGNVPHVALLPAAYQPRLRRLLLRAPIAPANASAAPRPIREAPSHPRVRRALRVRAPLRLSFLRNRAAG